MSWSTNYRFYRTGSTRFFHDVCYVTYHGFVSIYKKARKVSVKRISWITEWWKNPRVNFDLIDNNNPSVKNVRIKINVIIDWVDKLIIKSNGIKNIYIIIIHKMNTEFRFSLLFHDPWTVYYANSNRFIHGVIINYQCFVKVSRLSRISYSSKQYIIYT